MTHPGETILTSLGPSLSFICASKLSSQQLDIAGAHENDRYLQSYYHVLHVDTIEDGITLFASNMPQLTRKRVEPNINTLRRLMFSPPWTNLNSEVVIVSSLNMIDK